MQAALRLAVSDERPVIPVLLPRAQTEPNLPMFLNNRTWVDRRGVNGFRSLSEDGRCHFLLAGFWSLYRSASFDYQSPIKNFAQALQFGALELDVCRNLAVKPMQSLGSSNASESIVERILGLTGGRANGSAGPAQARERTGADQRVFDPAGAGLCDRARGVGLSLTGPAVAGSRVGRGARAAIGAGDGAMAGADLSPETGQGFAVSERSEP
jgi:hypothetical protein